MPLFNQPWLAVAVLWMLSAGVVSAQKPVDASSRATGRAWGGGNVYLAEVLATLERRPCVAAKLRQQVRLNQRTLVGAGEYWQQGTGGQRQSYWEMRTQVADKTTSITQVFDGKYLWTDRRLPSGRQIRRLDVARLQSSQGVRGFGQLRTQTTGASLEGLMATGRGRGGLAQLLAEMLQRFEFASPQATQLSGLPVDALIGRWRQPQLEKVWPALAPQEGKPTPTWPSHLPHHVLLLIGKSDRFPYLVEYRRSEDRPLIETIAGHLPCRNPLLRYELYEVQFAASVDSSRFEFNPGDARWTDETSLMISQLEQQPSNAPSAIR